MSEMCETERTRFFRPWNCVEEDLEVSSSSYRSTTIIHEEVRLERNVKHEVEEDDEEEEDIDEDVDEDEDDGESVDSSYSGRHYNSENDSTGRRSCSISSEDCISSGSLNLLNNFVHEDKSPEASSRLEHAEIFPTAAAATAVEWANASGLYPAGYQCPAGYQPNWPLQCAYLNSAGAVLGATATADYAWLPANYQSVQEAVHRLNQQDAVAKQMKKLRPKKFRCHYCNVAFSNNGQLKGHLRIHTGERPFKCDAEGCGKSFTRNEELTRHKRIHTGLRPYSCLICRKGFGRKDHLKKHTKTHDNRNIYQLAAVAAAATPFAGFPFGHHPSMPAATIPYMYPL